MISCKSFENVRLKKKKEAIFDTSMGLKMLSLVKIRGFERVKSLFWRLMLSENSISAVRTTDVIRKTRESEGIQHIWYAR